MRFARRSAQHVEREAEARRNAVAVARRGAVESASLRELPPAPAAGNGSKLPDGLRAEMERRFGQDFSNVRVARDAAAGRAARGFGAHAFTAGEQMSFAPGAWSPGTADGRALIAHELTHVVQQRASGRTEIACDGDASLDGRVQALQAALVNAKDAAERKPLIEQALALGSELAAALAAAKKAAPPDGGEPADGLRQLFRRLGSTLGDAKVDAGEAAIELAGKTPDSEVQSLIVNSLPSRTGVAGQQKFLRQVAPLGGQSIAAQGAGQNSRQWLKANTAAIGKTLSTLDQRGLKGQKRESLALERTEHLLGEYLTHSDKDERPDPLGDPAGPTLTADSTTQQIKADCDVYATIGARLLREQGWITVGYVAIIPN